MTTTNATTLAIITHLNLKGFKAWRNNNGAVYNVKTQGFQRSKTRLLGISDVLGFNRTTGRIVAVEIKTGKDKLSPEQELFLQEVRSAGGIGIVAKTSLDFENQFNSINH